MNRSSSKRFTTFGLLLATVLAFPAGAAQVVPTSKEQVTLTFAPVVKKVAPAVVNIYARKVIRQTPLFDDVFVQRFFGQMAPRERVENSLGSGVIVQPNGIVITNFHVAGDADEIRVVLSDRREFEAKVVGKDERSDLAVLQIQGASQFPALELSSSDDVEVGDLVLAIGDPFGVGQTVTSGIVSGLARATPVGAEFKSFIQTDAAINPGNSGGALVTSDGRLVGINTAIYSQTGGSIGIGFAIPSNMVRAVLTSILKDGKVVRPWFGASARSVTADIAKNFGLSRPVGVMIERVHLNSPAEKAGLQVGDIIKSINGREITDVDELRYQFATLPTSGTATLIGVRKGADVNLSIKLMAAPEMPPRNPKTVTGRLVFAGATVSNFNPALAEEMGREYREPTVLITNVGPGTVAASIGLLPGDIIVSIADKPITNVDQFMKAIADPSAWQCVLNRNGQTILFRNPR